VFYTEPRMNHVYVEVASSLRRNPLCCTVNARPIILFQFPAHHVGNARSQQGMGPLVLIGSEAASVSCIISVSQNISNCRLGRLPSLGELDTYDSLSESAL
jgi:hypothetical protein